MPTRAQVCTWIAAVGLLAPSVAAGQGRTEREIVELIVRDGPQAGPSARSRRSRGMSSSRGSRIRTLPSRTAAKGRASPSSSRRSNRCRCSERVTALSRAGVAATAAAEAERDLRLWLLRSDAADGRRSRRRRAGTARVRFEPTCARWNGSSRFFAPVSEKAKARDSIGCEPNRNSATPTSSWRPRRSALAEARATVSGMLPADVSLTTVARYARSRRSRRSRSETLFTRATSTRAELRALQQLGQRATFEADAARRSRLPSPNLFGGVKRADESGRTRDGRRVRGEPGGAAVR